MPRRRSKAETISGADAVSELTHGSEDLLRELAPQVLSALVRRHGQFDACEDAVQEALLAAATQWPELECPSNPAPG